MDMIQRWREQECDLLCDLIDEGVIIEMELSQQDILDLLVILNIALRESQDEAQKKMIREWIHKLSQNIR